MEFAISFIYGNYSYYTCFPDNKVIEIGPYERCDLLVPNLKMNCQVQVIGDKVSCTIIKNGEIQNIETILDNPVPVDKACCASFIVSKANVSKNRFVLPQSGTVNIGRLKEKYNNAIAIVNPVISKQHCSITVDNGHYLLKDLNSTNGLYVNGKRITSTELLEGDIISCYTVRMILSNSELHFENCADCLHLYVSPLQKIAPSSEDRFLLNRSPRSMIIVPDETVELMRPEEKRGTPEISWGNVLLIPCISLVTMVTMTLVTGMSPIMLVMSGVTTVASAIMAIVNYRKQKKEFALQDSEYEKKYEEYISEKEEYLKKSATKQKDALLSDNPAPSECLQYLKNNRSKLWNRMPEDSDFAAVRLGLGSIDAAVKGDYKKPEIVITQTESEKRAETIAQKSTVIDQAPIMLDLKENRQIGVYGERQRCIDLLRSILLELVTAHAYPELKLALIIPDKELDQWSWVRWLPHCMNNIRTIRYITTEKSEMEFLDEIEDELMTRCGSRSSFTENQSSSLPHYIFIIAKRGVLELHPIAKYVASTETPGCSAFWLYDSFAMLPKTCTDFIELSDTHSRYYTRMAADKRKEFIPETCTLKDADTFARMMCPYHVITEEETSALPDCVSFLEGYGVNRPEELDIGKRWHAAQPHKTLSVPIGAAAGGVFSFDIHEKHHGVNGIVAGMPGSGKTEMAQTWLLSMAVNYSPQNVSFILIDFKGTGLIAPFKNLPHVAGTISNLDITIGRNLRALKNEVHRREALLDRYSDLGIKNINDLNKAFAKGTVPEPMPVLLVVIDEFAEFRKVFPDFAEEIDSLTSKGRALGIFMVLMTQKPAGVVSARSEDNIKFRWCLRVANYSASREMIGRPDAAKITAPGRAFVKVGEDDVFEEVQAFYTGAEFNPNRTEDRAFTPISSVSLSGKKKRLEQSVKQASVGKTSTELEAVVNYICQYCKLQNIPNAARIWTDSLPVRISIEDLITTGFKTGKWTAADALSPIIGYVDDPDKQTQYPLQLDFAEQGHTLIFGAPVTGKTTLLQTVAMSVALTYSPDRVHMYIMDFGGWNLSVLKNLPHLGGIAYDNEPDKLRKLCTLISDIIAERKKLFSSQGYGNIIGYRDGTGTMLPDILLLVDNLGMGLKLYDMTDFFYDLANTGSAYGVYLVAVAGSSNSVNYRITGCVKNNIALQMNDQMDYSSLVGKVSEQLPSVVGRAYIKGKPPLEVQIALPANGEDDRSVIERITELSSAMAEAWQGQKPLPIPEMPEHISNSIFTDTGVFVGLTREKVLPVAYDWDKQQSLLLAGTNSERVAILLAALGLQLQKKLSMKWLVFDINGSSRYLSGIADNYVSDAESADLLIESLRPELQRRQQVKEDDPSACFEPMLFTIFDYATFYAAISNRTAQRLHAIAKLGTGLGLYLLIGDNTDAITNMVNHNEAVATHLAKCKQVVALGGCLSDHGFLQGVKTSSYGEKSTSIGDDYGFYISDGVYTIFKAIDVI